MTKGKLRINMAEEELLGGDGGIDAAPAPENFLIRRSRGRRVLNERDEKYNDGVRRLFDHITPGLPIDGDTIELRRQADPIGSVVEGVLKRLKVNFSPWLEELKEAWPQLVGAEVASVAQPGKFEQGILFVYVTTSVKLFELRRFHLSAIEKAVREFSGDRQIRQVRLMVNRVNL